LVEDLWLHVALDAQLDAVVVDLLEWVFDCQHEILEGLLSLGLVLAEGAVCVVNHLSLVEVPDEVFGVCIVVFLGAEGLLECFEEDSIELLDILLHLGILVLPLEALD
jgi:hypothetical protein